MAIRPYDHHKAYLNKLMAIPADAPNSEIVGLVIVKGYQEPLLQHPNPYLRLRAVEMGDLNIEQANRALADPNTRVVKAAVYRLPLNAGQMCLAFRHRSAQVRAAVVTRWKSLPEKMLADALTDSDWYVRFSAVDGHNLNMLQMEFALVDDNELVRKAAIHQWTQRARRCEPLSLSLSGQKRVYNKRVVLV